MRIGAIVLAAGSASRFGSPKQLLGIAGETLIDRVCRTALEAGCDPVLRLLGGHADKVLARPCPEGVETFVHIDWEEGMGSTLSAGTTHLLQLRPDVDAILVLLSDQPMVTVALLREMKHQMAHASAVWCQHGDVNGPPALFARKHFEELQDLKGDRGAKAIATRHAAATVLFEGGVWDIDSMETWQKFLVSGKA